MESLCAFVQTITVFITHHTLMLHVDESWLAKFTRFEAPSDVPCFPYLVPTLHTQLRNIFAVWKDANKKLNFETKMMEIFGETEEDFLEGIEKKQGGHLELSLLLCSLPNPAFALRAVVLDLLPSGNVQEVTCDIFANELKKQVVGVVFFIRTEGNHFDIGGVQWLIDRRLPQFLFADAEWRGLGLKLADFIKEKKNDDWFGVGKWVPPEFEVAAGTAVRMLSERLLAKDKQLTEFGLLIFFGTIIINADIKFLR